MAALCHGRVDGQEYDSPRKVVVPEDFFWHNLHGTTELGIFQEAQQGKHIRNCMEAPDRKKTETKEKRMKKMLEMMAKGECSIIEYVAFPRGINVGGNNKIGIDELRQAFISWGFASVKTVLASGNVIFETLKA